MSDRILVVDDSRAIRVVLVDTLRNEGYDCSEANDASMALEQLESAEFSLVRPSGSGSIPFRWHSFSLRQ